MAFRFSIRTTLLCVPLCAAVVWCYSPAVVSETVAIPPVPSWYEHAEYVLGPAPMAYQSPLSPIACTVAIREWEANGRARGIFPSIPDGDKVAWLEGNVHVQGRRIAKTEYGMRTACVTPWEWKRCQVPFWIIRQLSWSSPGPTIGETFGFCSAHRVECG